jgi:hypothetical protein
VIGFAWPSSDYGAGLWETGVTLSLMHFLVAYIPGDAWTNEMELFANPIASDRKCQLADVV